MNESDVHNRQNSRSSTAQQYCWARLLSSRAYRPSSTHGRSWGKESPYTGGRHSDGAYPLLVPDSGISLVPVKPQTGHLSLTPLSAGPSQPFDRRFPTKTRIRPTHTGTCSWTQSNSPWYPSTFAFLTPRIPIIHHPGMDLKCQPQSFYVPCPTRPSELSDRAGSVVDKKSTIFPRKVWDRPASSPFSFFASHMNHRAIFSSGKEEAIFFDEFSILFQTLWAAQHVRSGRPVRPDWVSLWLSFHGTASTVRYRYRPRTLGYFRGMTSWISILQIQRP